MMRLFLILALVIIVTLGCSKEPKNCDTNNLSYDAQIEPILERACNNSVCHTGSSGGWGVLPFFDSYNNILPLLEDGRIKKRLCTNDTTLMMPPFKYEERRLTIEERKILSCWLEAGFPEN